MCCPISLHRSCLPVSDRTEPFDGGKFALWHGTIEQLKPLTTTDLIHCTAPSLVHGRAYDIRVGAIYTGSLLAEIWQSCGERNDHDLGLHGQPQTCLPRNSAVREACSRAGSQGSRTRGREAPNGCSMDSAASKGPNQSETPLSPPRGIPRDRSRRP